MSRLVLLKKSSSIKSYGGKTLRGGGGRSAPPGQLGLIKMKRWWYTAPPSLDGKSLWFRSVALIPFSDWDSATKRISMVSWGKVCSYPILQAVSNIFWKRQLTDFFPRSHVCGPFYAALFCVLFSSQDKNVIGLGIVTGSLWIYPQVFNMWQKLDRPSTA